MLFEDLPHVSHLWGQRYTPRRQQIAEPFLLCDHMTPSILRGERDLKGGYAREHAARRGGGGGGFAPDLRMLVLPFAHVAVVHLSRGCSSELLHGTSPRLSAYRRSRARTLSGKPDVSKAAHKKHGKNTTTHTHTYQHNDTRAAACKHEALVRDQLT